MDIGRDITGLLGLALIAFALGLGAALYLLPRLGAADARYSSLLRELRALRAAAAAREKAEAASQAKSRFLATVSHEIRTPINGVLGLAQLLSTTRLEAEQASYVESIRDCARALAQLVDDILDFSKIEAGKLELRPEEFELAPLVEGVVELLAPRAQAKGLEIASRVDAEAPARIVADPARLRQILINLAANAVNFTQEGGVGVRIARRAPGELRFSVEDTGPGVPEAARTTIFGEFEQGEPLATRRGGGAGLGLAIARRLAQMMGGALDLAETSDEGSTFVFTLPIAPQAPARGRGGELAECTALIVAPSRFEAPFLAHAIEDAGARTEIAQTAAEGAARLQLVGATRPDIVVVDCAFGPEAVAALGEVAAEIGIARRLLMFSPIERRAFGEAALARYDRWLVKPLRAASLTRGLAAAASASPTPATAPPAPTLAGLHVLVAEDNEINALIAMRQLEALGAATTRAEDGARAVALCDAAMSGRLRRFDVVLMDLFMPELDGLEAMRRIRSAEARAGAAPTPILALTASAAREDALRAQTAGAQATLTKPLEIADLEAAIRAATGACSARARAK
jgi:signal transduction histidine kinase/CheY-like chemotaxis protein